MYSHIIKILKAIKLGTLEVSTYNLFFLFIFHLFFFSNITGLSYVILL